MPDERALSVGAVPLCPDGRAQLPVVRVPARLHVIVSGIQGGNDVSDGTPFVGKVQGQGKVTIPKNVRDLHGLKDGDYVSCVLIARIAPEASAPVPEASPTPQARPAEAGES